MSLALASATFDRATLFLGAGLRTVDVRGKSGEAPPIEGRYHAKVIGNGLRELDRFLNLLIDEVALSIAPPGLDHARFARQRNTANKLRKIRRAMALPSPDHDRLRAIGRSRDCLFHCAGIVRRGDSRSGTWMTVGWPDTASGGRSELLALGIGDRLIVHPIDLRRVCRFYDRVAAELLQSCEAYIARH